MLDEVLKYVAVYTLSMFKFIGGPILGDETHLTFLETAALTCFGMMTSVFIFSSVLGKKIHDWIIKIFYKNKKLFTTKNRQKVKIWRAYGMKGVAFFTPLLLTPIGGTLVATSFGESKKRIFFYMLASASFWSVIFSFLYPLLKDSVLKIF